MGVYHELITKHAPRRDIDRGTRKGGGQGAHAEGSSPEDENVRSSRIRWRIPATLVASAVAASATLTSGPAYADPDPTPAPDKVTDAPADPLDAHDRQLLIEAEANGEPTVTVLVATDRDATSAVAHALTRLGATVDRQVDAVGYVRARVPTAAVPKAATLPGVAALDLDERIPLPDPTPESRPGSRPSAPPPGPGPTTPAANPYLPTHETGAVSFVKAHPQWDGRGVTIGIMDTGVDLDHPALQTTTTGERKIIDWFTATDPLEDPSWRPMITQVTGPTFTFAGQTWRAPAGTWRINTFSESITAGNDPDGDVNRDGDTTDIFGILYDPATGDVRVDTNQNRDFTDDPVLRPYREKFDIGHFGVDNPKTAVREQVPFVVEVRRNVDVDPTDQQPGPYYDFVNIGIVAGPHGSHVAGIAAGHRLFGNRHVNGAAPGAKIVSARACSWAGGCSYAALTDGMIDLVVNRKVDVVNMSIGGLPALNDGNNARAILYTRLINDYGVQLVISAGNSGPGLNTVGDPSVATDVVSVAASISRETWLANYGAVVRARNAVVPFSSRGPREDGGLKPNVTAPGAAISTTPLWLPGAPVPEAGYDLPPGYQMLNGTSMAAPQVAGAVALLISAAKATGRAVSPAALRRALYTSAKWIDGAPAHSQGYGLVDVNGAWTLLRAGVPVRSYVVDAPVCTPISAHLATPHRGPGVFNRCAAGQGGHRVGEQRRYTIRVTRTSGPAHPITHRLSWIGNDGTFHAPSHVVLPLNRAVEITVWARPSAGVHSAILRVDDPTTSIVDAEIPHVVVAAYPLSSPTYAWSTAGIVSRTGSRSYFVTVPEGASALQVTLTGTAAKSHVRFIAINPYGVPVEDTSSLYCYTNFSDPETCDPRKRHYLQPIPGVWEIEVEARRTSPHLDNPFQLQVRAQGVSVEPATVELPSVTVGTPTPVTWTLRNTFGPVTVTGQGGPLGSVRSDRPRIADRTIQTYHVTVPDGVTRFEVSIGNPADPSADLDLYVRLNGREVGRAADGDAEETVSLSHPEPGEYEVLVVAYSVPAGTTEYDYRDAFFAPTLGTVTAPAKPTSLAHRATAPITATVTVAAPPPPGRALLGELAVVTTDGAVVGRGAVSISRVE